MHCNPFRTVHMFRRRILQLLWDCRLAKISWKGKHCCIPIVSQRIVYLQYCTSGGRNQTEDSNTPSSFQKAMRHPTILRVEYYWSIRFHTALINSILPHIASILPNTASILPNITSNTTQCCVNTTLYYQFENQ